MRMDSPPMISWVFYTNDKYGGIPMRGAVWYWRLPVVDSCE